MNINPENKDSRSLNVNMGDNSPPANPSGYNGSPLVASQMANSTDPTPNPPASSPKADGSATPQPPTVMRCLTGSAIASALALGLYSLTASIAQTFATKPLHSDNFTVMRIASAVRTLVVGLAALGTGVFGFAALGLLGLGIQLFIQRLKKQSETPSQT